MAQSGEEAKEQSRRFEMVEVGIELADEVELGNDLERVLERDSIRVGKHDSLPVLHSRIHANCNHSGCQLKHDPVCSRIEARLF